MSRIATDLTHLARMSRRVLDRTGQGPELLVQFVNSRCDCNCAHCFDWQRRGSEVERGDLTLDEIERIARALPRFFFVILTGGEPFLRLDLPDIALAYARHAQPRVIAIPTNGGHPLVIVPAVDRILASLPRATSLSINVSLDGVGELHDEIRGRKGQFAKATETVRGLQELAGRRDRLSVGVVSVISRRNQDHLEALMNCVLDDLQVKIWAPFLVRGEPRDPAVKDVDLARYREIAKALERRILDRKYPEYRGFLGAKANSAKNVVRRALIERIVQDGQRVVPCSAGRQAAIIYANGTVQPCELLDQPLGNLRDFDFDWAALWQSAGAIEARRVVDTKNCACTHENILTTSIAFAWSQWPAILRWTLQFGLQP